MLTEKMKNWFGGIRLTWPKVIVFAVIAGVYTAVMAIIPALHYTSFHTIAVTFEVWILFGILIIMNSQSPVDSALKCFVFFLISQPLVYLLQVPFSWQGWQLFQYYKYWFIWTVLCLPMGYIGYFMKKNKWWGYLILLPMILELAYSYMGYFSNLLFYFPKYILIVLFCAATMMLYPLAIFDNKKIKWTGAVISAVLIVTVTVIGFLYPPVYSTYFLAAEVADDTYEVCLENSDYGDVAIVYDENLEEYMVHAQFKKAGDTTLTLTSPTGEKTTYALHIERDTYKINKTA